ncbi:MAG: DUF1043 family protein [Pseudomonadota bacterium]
MDTVVWAALAVAGLLLGIGIGYWLGRLQDQQDRVAELESELDTYKAQVTEHFAQSATHFQAIGRQYRELYEHMAAGSETLCAPDARGSVSFPEPAQVSALAEPAVPVEPPVEAAAAATDVEDSDVIETTPYETDALAEDTQVETAESLAEAVPETVTDSSEVEPAVAVVADTDEAAVVSEPTGDAAAAEGTEVPADTIAESGEDPEKRLYH